ncbi:aminotransferase class IV [Puia dinghuensis]|uniref:branched-chain-amino-acid transaminase n=1 Tax=Puia dinghuensis TaxID=1792502 RepID=A0A8J2XTZ1_9BACT|nr:aminotransferase class IV [Puia dinghuensis]GGB03561.1 D-alanine aminotransferase [Puia dinghuensis]
MELFAFVNDDLVPAGQASLLVSDLSIQRGYAIFDFFKTLNHKPVFLDAHLERFFHSASRLRLEVGKSQDELGEMIGVLQRKNGIPDSGIRLELTGGYSEDGYTPPTRPNLVITQKLVKLEIAETLTRSLRLMTYEHQRQLPDVKTIDYLMAIWLFPLLREKGVDDVLYYWNGIITECPRSNFFIVTADDAVVTPARHILKGITRMKILEIAKTQFRVEERDVTVEELRTAKEAFVTSTTRNLLPVTQIDGVPIGTGEMGPVARWLNWEMYAVVSNGLL